MIIAVIAKFNLEAKQFDISNAFVYNILPDDEVVFYKLPNRFKELGKIVYLVKALYSLRLSPKLWYDLLSVTLVKLGFERCNKDPYLFRNKYIYLLFYIDDFIILYRERDKEHYQRVRDQLKEKFDIRELGDISVFLGIRMVRDKARKTVSIC